jgi:hypothetical protein
MIGQHPDLAEPPGYSIAEDSISSIASRAAPWIDPDFLIWIMNEMPGT